MNRPSCYGTTAKRSPYYRNHQCMNCPYILDCIEKEKMLEQTKTNPICYGTQPKPDTILWDDRKCKTCINLESCYRVTFGAGSADDLKRAKDYEKLKSENPDKFNFDPTAGERHTTLSAPEDKPDWTCPDCGGEYIGRYDISTHRVMTGCGKTKTEVGTKLDNDKLRWSLLPSGTIAQIIQVLEYGAKKYSVGNWVNVPDGKTRYYDAAMRHLDAWRGGEINDSESGLPHLAHAACCLLFLLWFDGKSVS